MIWSCCSGSLWTVILWLEVWRTRILNWPLEKAAMPGWWIRGPAGTRGELRRSLLHELFVVVQIRHMRNASKEIRNCRLTKF